jgi:hypothetical protein
MELTKAGFRVGVFPEFAAIMEKYPGDHKVAIEIRVNSANGGGAAHHLGYVFD